LISDVTGVNDGYQKTIDVNSCF